MERGAAFAITALPFLVFAVVALAEYLRPRRALQLGRLPRWRTAALFFIANGATGWILASAIAVPAAATWAAANSFGVLNWLDWPLWAEILIAFIALDFALWFQHLAMHKVPILWRTHIVHHADPDMDVSTAIRFHPFEIILSTLWKALCVAVLGVPALVALAFEAWLAANALFNHGNIRLPHWLDRAIRPFFVTPDMHLVHHSIIVREQQSNYGFALTIWDRLFSTYTAEPFQDRDAQAIGLAEAQDARPAGFIWSAKLPLT
jgi:sterol desaturase/sphingolipid hydroxylase (fatty acid hydroxylase superfamily)